MGAHHFKLDLVPPGVVPSRDGDGSYTGDFLVSFPIPDSIVQRLRALFDKTSHWGRVEEYASDKEWGSDLRIVRTDDRRISDVVFRFSPVADPEEKLREFIAIARDAGCRLLVESEGVVVAPEFDEVFQTLRTHHAFRFVSDPKGAILEAARKVSQSS